MPDEKTRSLAPALLGMALMAPLSVIIREAPVYFVQVVVIASALLVYMVRHRAQPFSFLDHAVLLYVMWAAFSFLLSLPSLLFSGRAELLEAQIVSFFSFLLTVSPYLLGRLYFQDGEQTHSFLVGVALAFGFLLLYYGILIYGRVGNLYLARHDIVQRVPLVITFVAWGVCALGFWKFPGAPLLLVLWMSGSFIVILSLTRASYLQWLLSAAAFCLISAAGHRRFLRRAAVTVVLAGVIAVAASTYLRAHFNFDPGVVVDRAGQLMHLRETASSDESASVRLEIWRRLGNRLLESPLRLLAGFGQLGPSPYLGGTFFSISGEYVSQYNAHSQYLDTTIRMGLVGLLLELAVLGMMIVQPFRTRLPAGNLEFFKAHSGALAGMVVYGIFHETLRWQMFGFYFWLYAGMVSAQLYCRKRVAWDAEAPASPALTEGGRA